MAFLITVIIVLVAIWLIWQFIFVTSQELLRPRTLEVDRNTLTLQLTGPESTIFTAIETGLAEIRYQNFTYSEDGVVTATLPRGLSPIRVVVVRQGEDLYELQVSSAFAGNAKHAVKVIRLKHQLMRPAAPLTETAAQPVALPVQERVTVPATDAVTTTPAGWLPDPTGRHELRYWDARRWTAHVSNNGVPAVDEL